MILALMLKVVKICYAYLFSFEKILVRQKMSQGTDWITEKQQFLDSRYWTGAVYSMYMMVDACKRLYFITQDLLFDIIKNTCIDR
jgi:hypothetical protein